MPRDRGRIASWTRSSGLRELIPELDEDQPTTAWLLDSTLQGLWRGAAPLTGSRAAAHPADEFTLGNTVRRGPSRGVIKINWGGQDAHGLVSCLPGSCLAQDVNEMLPGELHRDHRLLAHWGIAVPLLSCVESSR